MDITKEDMIDALAERAIESMDLDSIFDVAKENEERYYRSLSTKELKEAYKEIFEE